MKIKTNKQQQQKEHKFGCERIDRLLAFHTPARQGSCPTLLEPHDVTLSPGKRVGVGRIAGRERGMEEEKSKPKITKTVIIGGFSDWF